MQEIPGLIQTWNCTR